MLSDEYKRMLSGYENTRLVTTETFHKVCGDTDMDTAADTAAGVNADTAADTVTDTAVNTATDTGVGTGMNTAICTGAGTGMDTAAGTDASVSTDTADAGKTTGAGKATDAQAPSDPRKIRACRQEVTFDELPSREGIGTLKADYRGKDGKLHQIYSKEDNHVCVVAPTRAGKTTCVVIPTVISEAMQMNKKHMIITDPKGEVYERTAATLKAQGYKVMLLNFRDPEHSEYWNPLTPIYRKYMEYLNLGKEVELVETEDGLFNRFRGKIYTDQDELDDAFYTEKNILLGEAYAMADDFADQFVVVDDMEQPSWQYGARDIAKAVLYGMMEDIQDVRNPVTEEKFSIRTLISILDTFGEHGSLGADLGYFAHRENRSGNNTGSKAFNTAQPYVLECGGNTRASYLSSVHTQITEYKERVVETITSANTIEFDDFTDDAEGPTALFINFRDDMNTHYRLIALFVQRLYSFLIKYSGTRPGNRIERGILFMLDEFGNMPPLNNFDKVVSTCAGRNIWFHIILQSYAQLRASYPAAYETIKDNMNVHIFLGSNNDDTLEAFSRECGMYTRISPECALNGSGKEITCFDKETIPVVPVSKLKELKRGECVITEISCGYVMLSRMEPYYNCPEFNDLPVLNPAEYTSKVNPMEFRYIYDVSLNVYHGYRVHYNN